MINAARAACWGRGHKTRTVGASDLPCRAYTCTESHDIATVMQVASSYETGVVDSREYGY
jgi:hypothetical protein